MPIAGIMERRIHPAPDLTVVIPTFNERGNVSKIIEHLQRALAGLRWEVGFCR